MTVAGRSLRMAGLLAIATGGGASAEGAGPVEAPAYFVDTVSAMTFARTLSEGCRELRLDTARLEAMRTATLERLKSDGFGVADGAVDFPEPVEAFQVRRKAFIAKHGWTGALTPEMVCAAGMAEIAEGSEIGQLLAGGAG